MTSGDIVTATTSDGLMLQGFFSNPTQAKVALLHVHGYGGNFYENYSIRFAADSISEKVAFASVNTRGAGFSTGIPTVKGETKNIGGYYELLEEAHLDIDAWIEYLQSEGIERVILQGHSLGTVKAVRYLFEGSHADAIKKLILLAPFDEIGYNMKLNNTPIEQHRKRASTMVQEGKGTELVPSDMIDVTLSYQTFASWYANTDLGNMFWFSNPEYDFPTLNSIQIPTKVIVGTKDEFFHQSNPGHPEEAAEVLKSNIPSCQVVLIQGADHDYSDHEVELTREITSFL